MSEKLQRRGLPLSIESMESNLDDIAGVRVICSFVDDIYEISRMLERQDDVTIIAIKRLYQGAEGKRLPQLPHDRGSTGILFKQ